MRIKIYVGGFQRSGNTFLSRLIAHRYQIAMPHNHSYNHHVSSHMKYVENKETFPFVVPVRNAKEALISHYIHAKKLYNVEKSATNIELQIRNIKDMWEFVLQNDKFFIAPFKEFTQDPRDFFDKLEKKYPELRRKINLHFYIDEIYESLRNYEVETIPKDVYLEIGHYPREKSEFYDEAVFELNLDKYKKSLEHLNNLEKELVSRYK